MGSMIRCGTPHNGKGKVTGVIHLRGRRRGQEVKGQKGGKKGRGTKEKGAPSPSGPREIKDISTRRRSRRIGILIGE